MGGFDGSLPPTIHLESGRGPGASWWPRGQPWALCEALGRAGGPEGSPGGSARGVSAVVRGWGFGGGCGGGPSHVAAYSVGPLVGIGNLPGGGHPGADLVCVVEQVSGPLGACPPDPARIGPVLASQRRVTGFDPYLGTPLIR